MKFFIIEFLDLLLLSLFFVVLDFLKKFQNLDINIIVAYITIFKNSLIFFYLFKDKLNSYLFYIFRIILLIVTTFFISFFNKVETNFFKTIIEYLFIFGPVSFLLYLIIKKDIKNKGIKIFSVIIYQFLLICLLLEIAISIGYQ
ncbi:hypothetical protein HMPREF9942_01126 [Fusobacterium animalis F0419]|uniref:Uncharacterized protein n=1 Tax=Fusobacterium animalis F0419 TaxID=999414 RepID=H1HF75_9FUSO|nr:hypothetical protein [Fusobacterium animalis]EHO77938.1 hypothetical protein HMPREF9942_01126 [Fusobacterium animalis F0419]